MRANEPGPDAENADPQTTEARRENEEPDADEEPEIEGHPRRANEPAPDAENADPQTSEARRENEEPDAGEEPEIEGHRKLSVASSHRGRRGGS